MIFLRDWVRETGTIKFKRPVSFVSIDMDSVINKLDDILVQIGHNHDKEELRTDALRALIRSKPHLKKEWAVELYRRNEISLSRGAEIAGLNLEDFKESLSEKGVKIKVPDITKEEVDEEVDAILGVW